MGLKSAVALAMSLVMLGISAAPAGAAQIAEGDPAITLQVNSFARDSTYGRINWNMTVLQTNTPQGSCGYGCEFVIQGLTSQGAIETLGGAPRLNSSPTSLIGSGGSTVLSYTAVRVRLNVAELLTDWVPVSDSVIPASISVVVNSLSRNPSNGYADWNLSVGVHNIGSTPCGYTCALTFEGKTATGAIEYLGGATLPSNLYSGSTTWSGSSGSQAVPYVSVRARLNQGSLLGSDWVAVSDSVVTPSLSLQVNSFARNESGRVTWSFNAVQYNTATIPCGYSGCGFKIEGRTSSGVIEHLASSSRPTNQYLGTALIEGTGGSTGAAYTDVRLVLTNSNLTSPWMPVVDSVLPPAVSLKINSFARNSATGNVDWNFTASVQNVDSIPCGYGWLYGCDLIVEGKTSTGVIHHLAGTQRPANAYSGSVSFIGSGGSTSTPYVSVRVRLNTTDLATDWLPVADAVVPPTVTLTINEFVLDEDGEATWDFLASQVNTQGVACGYGCEFVVEGRTATGSVQRIAGAPRPSNNYSGSVAIVNESPSSSTAFTAVRLRLNPTSLETPWIPISSNVRGGHDLVAAGAAWASMFATLGPGACIAMFPVGPNLAHSSLNDYQLTCSGAVASGKSAAQVFSLMVATFGTGVVATMLVQGKYATSTPAPTPSVPPAPVAPPLGWPWEFVPEPAVPGAPPAPTPPRPDAAPPQLDAVYENNIVAHMMRTGWITSWSTLGTAGDQLQHAREVARQCVALASWPNAGHTEEDCETKPIFAPGADVIEAAVHDYSAIHSSPDRSVLTSRTGAEKAAAGVARGWYQSDPLCVPAVGATELQCDEYPFYTSLEGGPGASLRLISSADNRLEGTFLQGFQVRCGLNVPGLADGDRKYIVVPMPYGDRSTGTRTTAWCNK